MELTPRLGRKKLNNDGSDPFSDYRVVINANADAEDALDAGYEDFLQAGVVGATDWAFTANIIGGTGELGSVAATGGKAWLPDPVLAGALMRSVTPAAKLEHLKPPSLPASGKYRSIGVQLAPSTWGGAATVTLVSGSEKASQGEAEAAPAGEVAGQMRIRNVVVKNTAGTYSIVAQTDARIQMVVAAGAWTEPEKLGANIDLLEGSEKCVRSVGGATAQLRSTFRVHSGTLTAGQEILTLPLGLRPSGPVNWPRAEPGEGTTPLLILSTAGVLTANVNRGVGNLFYLDGLTFPLT